MISMRRLRERPALLSDSARAVFVKGAAKLNTTNKAKILVKGNDK